MAKPRERLAHRIGLDAERRAKEAWGVLNSIRQSITGSLSCSIDDTITTGGHKSLEGRHSRT